MSFPVGPNLGTDFFVHHAGLHPDVEASLRRVHELPRELGRSREVHIVRHDEPLGSVQTVGGDHGYRPPARTSLTWHGATHHM